VGPRASLDRRKISPLTGIRSPDRPARRSIAIPTELLGPTAMSTRNISWRIKEAVGLTTLPSESAYCLNSYPANVENRVNS